MRDSVGAQILKKMGWRPGQGVGPRVTYAQLRAQDGTIAPAELDAEDDEASKHLYAPRDTLLPSFARRTNAHGLGYAAGAKLNEIEAAGPMISGECDVVVYIELSLSFHNDSKRGSVSEP